MESEEVLLVIEPWEAPLAAADSGYSLEAVISASWMRGHVDATFVMRNDGDNAETLDVRFPLGVPDGFFGVAEVENFAAWVDGVPAPIREVQEPWELDTNIRLPWATWLITFPPGQQVTVDVAYNVKAGGYLPYGQFTYTLETGAGWYDTIGEGTITFRLPYEVNETNTVLFSNEVNPWVAPNPTTFELSDTDVIWHFTDLEPTAEDNVSLHVLDPHRWLALEEAQREADANPFSAQAQLELARALSNALDIRRGVADIGNWEQTLAATQSSYRRAIDLAPDNPEMYAEYVDFLIAAWTPWEPSVPPDDLIAMVERGLELDPGNEGLLYARSLVDEFAITPTPVPTLPTTATPDLSQTPAVISQTVVLSPEPEQSGRREVCGGLLGIVVLSLAAVWVRKVRRPRHGRRIKM
jgi:hypothetical protein